MTAALFYRGPSFTQLHEHYAKRGRIDGRAPVVCSVSTEVSAPVTRVWQVLSDLAGWPSWYPVDRHLVEPLPGGRTRVTIAESLAGPLLPLLYPAARLRAGHERWLAAFRRAAEASPGAVNAG